MFCVWLLFICNQKVKQKTLLYITNKLLSIWVNFNSPALLLSDIHYSDLSRGGLPNIYLDSVTIVRGKSSRYISQIKTSSPSPGCSYMTQNITWKVSGEGVSSPKEKLFPYTCLLEDEYANRKTVSSGDLQAAQVKI
jgi:hypothetical protein